VPPANCKLSHNHEMLPVGQMLRRLKTISRNSEIPNLFASSPREKNVWANFDFDKS